MKQQHKLTVRVKGLAYNLDSSNKTASVGINSEASGDVIIPDTIRYKNADFAVTGIGEDAFCCANLTSVIIGNSVSSIGKNAFAGCHGLTSVEIPDSVTTIGDYAFCGAELTSMFCKAETPPYAKQAFSNNLSKATLYVPIGCADIYKQTYPWSTFGNIVEIDFYGVQISVDDSTPIA